MLSLTSLNQLSAKMEIAGVEKKISVAKKLVSAMKIEFENLIDFLSKNNLVQVN